MYFIIYNRETINTVSSFSETSALSLLLHYHQTHKCSGNVMNIYDKGLVNNYFRKVRKERLISYNETKGYNSNT